MKWMQHDNEYVARLGHMTARILPNQGEEGPVFNWQITKSLADPDAGRLAEGCAFSLDSAMTAVKRAASQVIAKILEDL